MTGPPVRTCRRSLVEADADPAAPLEFLLAREDDVGARIAVDADDAEELTARLERDSARLAELAKTRGSAAPGFPGGAALGPAR